MKSFNFVVLSLVFILNSAVAAEAPMNSSGAKGQSPISVEQRQKMAGLHEKMAVCLRSDRPLPECREEMMKGCKEGMGGESCPMMGGKGHHGMHHSMMDGQSPEKE
jgi:hypothetical protein